jgi:hypothetical protein
LRTNFSFDMISPPDLEGGPWRILQSPRWELDP